mmetsp:Transcript_10946/g.25438  ORF Transcript_10946/g.25438 Transcript_10946/m.25438 type:complete len:131 (-) Transcript_10946:41-433(-)
MTFIEFMEAMAWIADLMPIPTEAEMIKLNIKTRDPKEPFMIEFEMRVAALEDNVKKSILVRRPSTEFMAYDLETQQLVPKLQAMDYKLDRFLYLLGGRLGIFHGGRLPGNKGYKFVPNYISIAQLDGLGV